MLKLLFEVFIGSCNIFVRNGKKQTLSKKFAYILLIVTNFGIFGQKTLVVRFFFIWNLCADVILLFGTIMLFVIFGPSFSFYKKLRPPGDRTPPPPPQIYICEEFLLSQETPTKQGFLG